MKAEQGLPRLRKLCELWLDYANRKIFRGGCFFAAASAEFDSRPGLVRDRIAEIMKEWLGGLRRTVIEAQEANQLDRKVDPSQLVFEINSLEMGANWAFQLHGDKQAFGRARLAIFERLRRHSKPRSSAKLVRGKSRRPITGRVRAHFRVFTQRRKGGKDAKKNVLKDVRAFSASLRNY